MKNVLITGALSGLGYEIAKNISPDYNLILTYNKNKKKINNLKNKLIIKKQFDFKFYKLDLSTENTIKTSINKILKDNKNIDIFIGNAALSQHKNFFKITDKDFKSIIDVNVIGNFHILKLILPRMMKNKWGRVILISSVAAQLGGSRQIHYAVSKSALNGLNKSIAKNFSKYGITSNTISPGIFPTEMTKNELKLSEVKKSISNMPIPRIGKLSEISGIINFLASNESSYITGQNININGGMFFS